MPAHTQPPVTISRFQPTDRDQVIKVILPIQNQEFGIAITAEQQPDLSDIPGFYQCDGGEFWVARCGSEIIGTLGLKDIGNQQAALRKMFVTAAYRGRAWSVAPQLLAALFRHAAEVDIRDIYLGTTDKFLAAQRFYEKQGFSEVAANTLPAAFPRMAVDSKFYRWSAAA
ncbi:GNAT family N-acetyltransferase [Chimaeribacter californicus]|uniref:GNAT family N-acetyltransferase n=1 Tax=Chimaeribacter californicus TaxID=2060067 RepID=A0A2N5EFV0_9GAMM|nr:GNAT family N-acetyltransferase [Chimaeribacter californicus]PLR41395.1 GNAT family N-acetyltransferase [Chimaeribacter californicus]